MSAGSSRCLLLMLLLVYRTTGVAPRSRNSPLLSTPLGWNSTSVHHKQHAEGGGAITQAGRFHTTALGVTHDASGKRVFSQGAIHHNAPLV